MTDSLNEIGKYINKSAKNADLALKRSFVPEVSIEKVRDIFDVETPFQTYLKVEENTSSVFMDITFGSRLPSTGCCADCLCGFTESYTSDSLVSNNIYLMFPYLPGSTVVFLDGIRATAGVEYTESSPANNQLYIPTPFSTITISYVHEVGNCSDGSCEDTFPCPEFALFSGLATVFADRFDRGISNSSSYGNCGTWASNITASGITPAIPNITYAGTVNVNSFAALGGAANVSGATIEVVAAIGGGQFSSSLGLINQDDSVGARAVYNTSTELGMSLSGTVRYTYRPFPSQPNFHNTNDDQFTKFLTTVVTAEFREAPKFIRLGQYPTGELYLSIWEQGSLESTGHILQLGLSDWTPPDIGDGEMLEFRLLAPAIYAVNVNIDKLQAIKVGAGLDPGDWLGSGGGDAYEARLTKCNHAPPYFDGSVNWPYYGQCDVPTFNITAEGGVNPTFQAFIGFPIVIGDVPPPGYGRVLSVDTSIGTISNRLGHASYYEITGKIAASFAANISVSAIFQGFPGAGFPSPGNNNFNGTHIGSVALQTDGTYVPFSVLIPCIDGAARWGMHIPNIDNIAENLDFIFPAFLSPPSYYLTLSLLDVEIKAHENVQCTAEDTCGSCEDHRCPEVTDSLDLNLPVFITPSSKEIPRALASGGTMIVEQDDGVVVNSSGGVATVSWEGTLVDSFSGLYLRYSESPFECRTDVNQNISASFEFKLNSLPSGYTEIAFGGFYDGPEVYIEIDGGITDAYTTSGPFESIPLSVAANIWYTGEYKIEGNNLMVRIYESTGTPSSWTILEDTVSTSEDDYNTTREFYVEAGYSQTNTPSSYEVQLKNIIIRRI